MLTLSHVARPVASSCKGCGKCLRVCPAEAIVLESKLAQVDGDRCIDCMRCVDACPEDAMVRSKRPEEVLRCVGHTQFEPERIEALCEKLGYYPEQMVCACTATTAAEVCAALFSGADTPDAVCAMTGMRQGCGIYCLGVIFRFLEAYGVELKQPKDNRWYPVSLSLFDTSQEVIERVDARFPQYRIKEDSELLHASKYQASKGGDSC